MDDQDFSGYAAARWGALMRSAVVLGCSTEEAHDLAQTTLLRCYTKWEKVLRAEDRNAYVYRVLLNCHRDSRRRHWWGEQPSVTALDMSAGEPTSAVDAADAVHRALSDLPLSQREVVVLRYMADLSEARTAEVLGVAPGTVKSRLSRALSQLEDNSHIADLAEGQAR